jgi:hypothetical protein
MTWQEAVWKELEVMTPLERFVACGAWITEMQQEMVPALAENRRLALVEESENNDNDYLLLAERIGTRKATVERLVNEGRQMRREHIR